MREALCSLDAAMCMIGGKWKMFILWNLKEGKKRFNQMLRLIPSITQKMLTQQLRELERDGIIDRKVFAQVPPKVEYSLTPTGKTLIPILTRLCQWAMTAIAGAGIRIKE